MSAGRSAATRDGEPLLDVRGLCADYGAGPGAVHAVMDADLMLHRGEVLGLAGAVSYTHLDVYKRQASMTACTAPGPAP